ncbi:MAG: acyl-CoA mutase large subunit family protein [Bacteroidetes bacterium]|nr:acyl-CoA mutase large subunit family protein [Bacteroidota bacterium]
MDHKTDKLFPEFPPVTTEEWEAKITEDLKGADYNKKLIWKTQEGFDIKPYYRSEDLNELSHLDAQPGEYPFVRGNEIRYNHWEIRQEMSTADPKDANFEALASIKKGATGIGFGASGIKTLKHIETLLKGICFGDCSVHFGGAKSYPDLVNLMAEHIRKHHLNKVVIKGSFDFDPISYLLLEGDFFKSEESDMAQVAEMISIGKKDLPAFKMITVNGQYFHNSGSTLIQELAFSLASGNEYLANAVSSGFKVDDVAPRIVFSFAVGSNYFPEIAKLRAARMLWARIVEQYNPSNEASMLMNIHCSTSHFNKTLYDPHVNVLRTTTEAMSAILGGTNSLNITPFDAFYKDPDLQSTRIARNQQIILKEESYLERVIDPAAGSYYIENLTDQMARTSWELFQKVEGMGGMIAAIKEGFIQADIKKQEEQRKLDVATRKMVLLGTNQYPNLNERMLEKIQMEEESLDIEEQEEKPTRYPKMEISRLTDDFDDLRLATELYVEDGNRRPAAFLLTMGNLAMRKARAMFSTNFFGCAGYAVIDNSGFATVEEGVQAALKSKAEVIVICSSDEEYPELAPSIAKQLKSGNKDLLVILAGYPKEIVEDLKNAGIDDFIHVRTNVLEFLQKTSKQLGIYE